LGKLAEKAPSPGEFRRARDYVIGQLDLSLENTENQMMWLGEQYIGYGKVESPAELKSKLADVTAAQVKAAARDFFQADRMNLALVSPLKKSERLDRLIVPEK
jgi:predicted Zn-dependent peptidase